MKLKSKMRAAERRSDTAKLAAPQLMPMLGDGPAAQALANRLRGNGPDSTLARGRHGWRVEMLRRPSRADLVAARYEDWLASRDAISVSFAA